MRVGVSVVGSGVTGQAGGVSKEAVPVARWLGTEVVVVVASGRGGWIQVCCLRLGDGLDVKDEGEGDSHGQVGK